MSLKPQVLLQLRDTELEQAESLLIQGQLGLEILDFANPALLAGDWEKKLEEMVVRRKQWAGPITLHGPFLDLSPASPDPGLRDLTLHRYRQALYIANKLQASHVVFHTQYNPNVREQAYLSRWLAASARFWSDLLSETEASDVTVVLENMWDPYPDHIASLLAAVNNPRLCSCLDVAHAHLFSQVPLTRWVDALGEKLIYIHLSDNRGQWDEHLPLGEGTIDFDALVGAIVRRGLRPWYVLEVPSFGGAMDSLRFMGW